MAPPGLNAVLEIVNGSDDMAGLPAADGAGEAEGEAAADELGLVVAAADADGDGALEAWPLEPGPQLATETTIATTAASAAGRRERTGGPEREPTRETPMTES